MAKRRKLITLTVTVSVAHDVTKAHAKRELRTRVNDLSAHHSYTVDRQSEESDVRVRKVS